jgi:3'-phosphoadenosine 5'-phosphosulfate sulfotransferase
MNMARLVRLLALLAILVVFIGCSQRVPPGYVGMVMKPNGLTGVVLHPGNHTCWGRDRMALMEMVEATVTEKMAVLCKDDLNMKFDLKVRARLKTSEGESMMAVLNRQGSKMVWAGDRGVLEFKNLYETYVSGPARSIARGVVSKYNTTDIRGNRKAIEGAIRDELLLAVKGTPVEITMVVTSNLDYPDVITIAMESKRQREISIDQEKAQQAIELLKAENRLKVAQKMKITRAAEAEAEAVYNDIMSKSLNDRYLMLRDIEAKLELYKAIQKNDKIIITDGKGVTPMLNVNPSK